MSTNAATSTKSKEEQLYWSSGKHDEIFQAVIAGKQKEEIIEELKIFEDTYVRAMVNNFFQKRLRNWLEAKEISDYVTSRIKLREEFDKRFSNASDDFICRAFLSLSLGKSDKKNTILKILKNWQEEHPIQGKKDSRTDEEKVQDVLKEDFGCETPTKNEQPKHTSLAEGESTPDKQETTN